MTSEHAILVRLLAHVDGLRLAIRNWQSNEVATNRYAAMQTLWRKGVPFRINSQGDEAGRKAREVDLVQAAGDGLIVLTRDRTKWPHCKLTEKGIAIARSVCNLPDRKVGRLFLCYVGKRLNRDAKTMDRAWLAENVINDGKGWGFDATAEDRRRLSLIEQDYLAAASAGWAVAHSDIQGHAYYRPTLAGWQEIDSPSPAPAVGKLPDFEKEAAKLYREVQDLRLREMTAKDTTQTSRDIGWLPLPVALIGVAFTSEVSFDFGRAASTGDVDADADESIDDLAEVQTPALDDESDDAEGLR